MGAITGSAQAVEASASAACLLAAGSARASTAGSAGHTATTTREPTAGGNSRQRRNRRRMNERVLSSTDVNGVCKTESGEEIAESLSSLELERLSSSPAGSPPASAIHAPREHRMDSHTFLRDMLQQRQEEARAGDPLSLRQFHTPPPAMVPLPLIRFPLASAPVSRSATNNMINVSPVGTDFSDDSSRSLSPTPSMFTPYVSGGGASPPPREPSGGASSPLSIHSQEDE